MSNELAVAKFLLDNWSKISKIPEDIRDKIKILFRDGKKEIGFIRNKDLFAINYRLSQSGFLKKYSRYIVPAEYRSYLLESIKISNLYESGKNEEGDKLRSDLGRINLIALRVYNLFNTGVLNIVFSEADRLEADCKNAEEITGAISKLLDDLINDKSLIYANEWDNKEALYNKMKTQLLSKKYCVVFGSGRNVDKIKYLFDKVVDDADLMNYETKYNKQAIGQVQHFYLAILEKPKSIVTNDGK